MASQRFQDGENWATRTADNGNSEGYPCRFSWEITDERLITRLQERVMSDSEPLTMSQLTWYMKRLNFRNIPVSADLLARVSQISA